jgi:RIO-like serine/threonine protein kinase
VTQVSLGQVFEEIKRMRLELKTIEQSLDSLAESLIPEGEKLSPEEIKELDALEKEMEEGQCVPLEKVLEKHEVTKRGKVPTKRSQKNR